MSVNTFIKYLAILFSLQSNFIVAQSPIELTIVDHLIWNIDQENFPQSKGKYLVFDYKMTNNSEDTIKVFSLDRKAYKKNFMTVMVLLTLKAQFMILM